MSAWKLAEMVAPSRSPPPKKATLSACVRRRLWMLRNAPSRWYSCAAPTYCTTQQVLLRALNKSRMQ